MIKRISLVIATLAVMIILAACTQATPQPATAVPTVSAATSGDGPVPGSPAASASGLYVCVDLANIRTGPGTTYPILKQATQGEPVNSTQKNGEWYYLGKDASGVDSYIHESVVCSRSGTAAPGAPTALASPATTGTVPSTTPAATAVLLNTQCAKGCLKPPAGCVIKGNISRAGVKTYYLPDDKGYGEVVIDPDYDERWFCTEQEAQANGWKRAP